MDGGKTGLHLLCPDLGLVSVVPGNDRLNRKSGLLHWGSPLYKGIRSVFMDRTIVFVKAAGRDDSVPDDRDLPGAGRMMQETPYAPSAHRRRAAHRRAPGNGFRAFRPSCQTAGIRRLKGISGCSGESLPDPCFLPAKAGGARDLPGREFPFRGPAPNCGRTHGQSKKRGRA